MFSRKLAALLTCGAFAACESEISAPVVDLKSGELELNASATNQYTYFNLTTGQTVAVADPPTSAAWDLAIRRYEVRLNGGAVGPKGVAGHNLANNASATPAQILGFTPANQKPGFDAVGTTAIPATATFIQESLVAMPLGWLSFGAQGPVANGGAAWKLRRTAGGGHGLFRAIGITVAGSSQQNATLASVTVEWRYQPTGGTLGTKQQATITLASGNSTISFATGALGPATGCDWDIRAGADFSIVPNVACNGGTFPVSPAESFDALTTASGALQYGAFLAGVSGAVPFTAALDDPRGPFLYNLAGDNRLSPTFNIYLVQVGTAVFKIQLTSYYSSTGASGYPTLRYAQLR